MKNYLIIVVVIMFIALIPDVSAEASLWASRDIEDQNLVAGGSTKVMVTMINNVTQALSLMETLPTGWTLTPVLDDADAFKNSTNEWIWFDAGAGVTKVVIYQLDVPLTTIPGTYNIIGNITNSSGTIASVFGGNSINIFKNETFLCASRDIEDQNLVAGGSTNVTVTIMNNVTQALSLMETLPTGWTLTPVQDDADTFKNSTNEWVWFNAGAVATKTVIYQLNVPSTTGHGAYNITGNITNSSGIIAGVSGESIIHIYTTSSVINISCVTVDVNDTVVLPVTIANIINIQQVTLDLIYDPDVAIILNITASDTLPSSNITHTLGSGTATIEVAYLENITVTSPTPFINITYKTGEYNATTALEMQNVELIDDSGSHAPDTIINGSLIVCIKGDFNYNNRVDIGDIAKVAFMVAGKIPEDPRADFNNNGRVDIGDAAKISFYVAGKVKNL